MARFDFAVLLREQLPPPPNCSSIDSVVAAGCGLPVGPRILQNQRAVPHPRPILRPNLPVAELDYGPPGMDSLDSWAAYQSKPATRRQPR